MGSQAADTGSIEVVGAGWGRTGTLSLKTALEMLGLPCYHMVDCMKNPGHDKLWIAAADGQPVDFKSMLGQYKAVVDWPGVAVYKQLMEQFPDAKVILTVRDPAKWYKSAKDSVYRIHQMWSELPWYVNLVHCFGPMAGHRAMVDRVIWDAEGDLRGCFGSDPQRAQQLFMQHIEEVKQVVPAERLLVFEASQGWGPLCAFLGKPVPQQPFPHVNDAQQWQERLAAMGRMNTRLVYGVPAAAAALVAVAALLVRRWGLRV